MLTIKDAVDIVTEASFKAKMGFQTEENSQCLVCIEKNVDVFVYKVYDQLRDKILEFKFCHKCLLNMASEIKRTCKKGEKTDEDKHKTNL